LQFLDLNYNNISDISILKDFVNLQTLCISGNSGIKDFSILKHFKKLKKLDLSGNRQIEDLSVLKDMTDLQTLDLSYNEQIEDFSVLKDLNNLQSLNLTGNAFFDISPLLPLIRKGIPVKMKNDRKGGIILEKCPIANPPMDILMKGNVAILRYFGE